VQAEAWRVSWSQTGGLLAVSDADNKVTVYKQALTGSWDTISELQQEP
jgi:protein transport protein SEC13